MTSALRTKEHYEVTKRIYSTTSDLAYMLDIFGDTIATREGYKTLSGIEAIHFYICRKFRWKPSDVRAMTSEDLRFLLSE